MSNGIPLAPPQVPDPDHSNSSAYTPEEYLPGEVHVGPDFVIIRFSNGHSLAIHAGPAWQFNTVKMKDYQLSLSMRRVNLCTWDACQKTVDEVTQLSPDSLADWVQRVASRPSETMDARRQFQNKRRQGRGGMNGR